MLESAGPDVPGVVAADVPAVLAVDSLTEDVPLWVCAVVPGVVDDDVASVGSTPVSESPPAVSAGDVLPQPAARRRSSSTRLIITRTPRV